MLISCTKILFRVLGIYLFFFMHLAKAFIQSNLHHTHFFFLVDVFPGNQTDDLGVAGATLYCLSCRNPTVLRGAKCQKFPHLIALHIFKNKNEQKTLLRQKHTHSVQFRNTLTDRFLHETFVRTKHSSKLPVPQYVCNTHSWWHMALLTCLICCLPTQWCVCVQYK